MMSNISVSMRCKLNIEKFTLTKKSKIINQNMIGFLFNGFIDSLLKWYKNILNKLIFKLRIFSTKKSLTKDSKILKIGNMIRTIKEESEEIFNIDNLLILHLRIMLINLINLYQNHQIHNKMNKVKIKIKKLLRLI